MIGKRTYPLSFTARYFCSVIILFLLLVFSSHAQVKDRLTTYACLGGSYPYYKENKNHLDGLRPGIGYAVSLREELRFESMVAIAGGLEFFSHSLKFNSYYFSQGHSFLYDKKFDYSYKLNIYEISMPLTFRANYMGMHRDKPSAYFEIGPAPRYLLFSRIKVEDKSGIELVRNAANTEFEYPLITRKLSMFLQFNTGLHIYNKDKDLGYFIELNTRFAPIRFLVSESFTASSLYFQNFHFGLCGGISF